MSRVTELWIDGKLIPHKFDDNMEFTWNSALDISFTILEMGTRADVNNRYLNDKLDIKIVLTTPEYHIELELEGSIIKFTKVKNSHDRAWKDVYIHSKLKRVPQWKERKEPEKPTVDLFKMHEGFNTDILKPGAVFFMHWIDHNDSSHVVRSLSIRTKQENILVRQCTPTTLSFQTATLSGGMQYELNYVDVKSGLIEIREMRELK